MPLSFEGYFLICSIAEHSSIKVSKRQHVTKSEKQKQL